MMKSMTEHLAQTGNLDSPRKHRFSHQFCDDLENLTNSVTNDVIASVNKDSRNLKVSPIILLLFVQMCLYFFFSLLDLFTSCIRPPVGLGLSKRNKLIVWSIRVIDHWMVQGSWVGDPLHVSFFSLLFSVLLFIPYERINFPGWGWVFHPLCLDPFPFS